MDILPVRMFLLDCGQSEKPVDCFQRRDNEDKEPCKASGCTKQSSHAPKTKLV